MKSYLGKSVNGESAIGKIRVFKRENHLFLKDIDRMGPDEEMRRYQNAKTEVLHSLQALCEKVSKSVGETQASIFEAHGMILEDETFQKLVETLIRGQNMSAEDAVATAGRNLAAHFAAMPEETIREREADIRDLTAQLLDVLQGRKQEAFEIEEPVIIVAEELTPSQTVQMDSRKVLAFVTERGALNSHVAILAETMGIPALVGVLGCMEVPDGVCGIVDGETGTFYAEPDEEVLADIQRKMREKRERQKTLLALHGKESVTPQGQKIELCANIGDVKDLEAVFANDAEGIGLFRSEFLYLQRDSLPTEEELFQVYREVVQAMDGKRVVIRTLDIGADKKCDYLGLEKEENPALGYRGIRICLARPEIFKTQLRALLRAAAYGRLAVMYPMIIGLNEIHRIKEIVEEVRQELLREGSLFGEPEQGIMVETPAAVMVSRELAEEVDFFSIGTNDLTQYTLAIDRQNPRLEDFYDAHHPAVLRMIETVVQNAHQKSKWVGICGELGADPELTEFFLKIGVDELSMSPGHILPIRKIVRETYATD